MTDQTVAAPPQPSDQPAASPLPATAQSRPARTLPVPVRLVAGLTGFAAGAATIGLAWGLSSDGSPAPAGTTANAGAAANAETFTLIGSMTLSSDEAEAGLFGATLG